MTSRVMSDYWRSGDFNEDLLAVGAFISELSFFLFHFRVVSSGPVMLMAFCI
jgi:hypothetical protein